MTAVIHVAVPPRDGGLFYRSAPRRRRIRIDGGIHFNTVVDATTGRHLHTEATFFADQAATQILNPHVVVVDTEEGSVAVHCPVHVGQGDIVAAGRSNRCSQCRASLGRLIDRCLT